MSDTAYLMAIDQGTTSSRALVFDSGGKVIAIAQQEFAQHYPASGWVEHNPEEIWQTTLATAKQALADAEQQGGKVVAIGITNQRETSVVWDKASGRAIYNAIVWQDRRTASQCENLYQQGALAAVQSRTGLLLDPYFSATKISWILDEVSGARQRAEQGLLAFGTIDSFLIWRLTGGKRHVTDATNASRTMLFNIHTQCWDNELLRLFNVPASMLPEVLDCTAAFGETDPQWFGRAVPILGVAGDQQAAAIGNACLLPGTIKSTYGTGCFVLMNTGEKAVTSQHRLLTTVACRHQGKATYALEGSIFIAGAAVQWLRDGLKVLSSAGDTEAIVSALDDNHGMYLVPAFTGLGAPYWEPNARGALFGITRATGPAQLVRCALESVCYQTSDLLTAMAADSVSPTLLRVDGGMTANNWLLQFLADVLNVPVARPTLLETTAWGAASLAGIQAGVFSGFDDLERCWQQDKIFSPRLDEAPRNALLSGWKNAVEAVIGYSRTQHPVG